MPLHSLTYRAMRSRGEFFQNRDVNFVGLASEKIT